MQVLLVINKKKKVDINQAKNKKNWALQKHTKKQTATFI